MDQNKLWRITFDTNPDDCNLSCVMCEDHSPYSNTLALRKKNKTPRRRMPIELVEKIFQQAKELGVKEIIPSTMGEPLIFPKFERIIELCYENNVMLNLTTNGTFPKKGAHEWAKLIVPITTDVKISWNGATKETQESVMLGTDWNKVLENVRAFVAVRDAHAESGGNYCSVTLQLTFMEANVDELHDVVKLGVELGIDRIKGHQLWTHGFSELEKQSLRKDKDSILRWNAAAKKCHQVATEHLLKNGKKINLVNFELLDESALTDLAPGGECPFLGKEAWVASDGRFNPCCAPDKERRGLGDFGNLNDMSLSEIFSSDQYQDLCQNYMKNAVCQKCNMRKPIEQAVDQKVEEVAGE